MVTLSVWLSVSVVVMEGLMLGECLEGVTEPVLLILSVSKDSDVDEDSDSEILRDTVLLHVRTP